MRSVNTKRLIAILLMLSVCVFVAQGINHFHEHSADEQHCQVCHIGHAAIPRPAALSLAAAHFPIARYAFTAPAPPETEAEFSQRIPRAPPASL
jgi:hypothetical protein